MGQLANYQVTRKGECRPRKGHESLDGEERHSSTLSLTSALDEGGWVVKTTPEKKPRYLL